MAGWRCKPDCVHLWEAGGGEEQPRLPAGSGTRLLAGDQGHGQEALHDALYVPGEGEIDLAWSRRLTRVSFAVLWTLAAYAGDMVIEANFHPHNEEALGQLHGLGGRTVEVHCACPAEVAHARYNAGRATRFTRGRCLCPRWTNTTGRSASAR